MGQNLYYHKCVFCKSNFSCQEKHQKFCSQTCYFSNIKKSHLKTCIQCGAKFSGKRKTQKFCSIACYLISHARQKKNCLHCNKILKTTKKFCDKKCMENHFKKNTKLCLFCKKETTNKIYCSKKCLIDYAKSNNCLQCNEPISANKKFCSIKCYNRNRQAKRKKCLKCGKLTTNQKYCSKNCFRAPIKEKKCLLCGRFFKKRNPIQNYCSMKCYKLEKEKILQTLIKLYKQEVSIDTMAAELYFTKRTVYLYLKELIDKGILEKRKTVRKKTHIDEKELIRIYHETSGSRKIMCEHFNVSANTLSVRLRELKKQNKIHDYGIYVKKKIVFDDDLLKAKYLEYEGSKDKLTKEFKCSYDRLCMRLRYLREIGDFPEYGSFKNNCQSQKKFLDNIQSIFIKKTKSINYPFSS